MIPDPTPYPEINRLLRTLFARQQEVLGERIVALYLEGSLANGGFDADSDVDFVLVTADEIEPPLFAALRAMHDEISGLDTPWAIQLEGSYLSRAAIRRYDPARRLYPNIERGPGERLKLADHDRPWDIHRSILRERGIPLFGPPADTLIDPVGPGQLRQAMRVLLDTWAARILEHPEQIDGRGYQSYVVLSLCRVLYTLEHAAIASKPQAVAWAQETLAARWRPLIARAWEGRQHPGLPADPADVQETLAFIGDALGRT